MGGEPELTTRGDTVLARIIHPGIPVQGGFTGDIVAAQVIALPTKRGFTKVTGSGGLTPTQGCQCGGKGG